ncbi:AGE family epimerase/isomerase [Paracoccus sp. PARArs4]|uniref:AGE family epimerase/isomerase n=1 Tax=Paracoccus sp. PARArs4 TaxID=2853442 RepID=UPI0024A73F89|nr:AGE family epimerase/isomerase [Paracoccus sp. PARArs4]
MQVGDPNATAPWLEDAMHRAFLVHDAKRALDFFDRSARQGAGFHVLDLKGAPQASQVQEIHTTTRLVHSYALALLAGRPDRAGIIDRGMDFLWSHHRDAQHGGYLWGLDDGIPMDRPKLAYGHVFVLLAASSAKLAGHPDADRLLTDITEVLDRHYWDDGAGLFPDEFTRDWQVFSGYRGMNANMHGVEALLAAHEATGEAVFLDRAGRILRFFIAGQAASHGWRIPEHYHEDWSPDTAYAGDPMFRPAGTTPGHSFEMARLLLQWWDAAGRPAGDAVAQARALVDTALADAWNPAQGGLAYTLQMDGAVDIADRYWWPVTEAIGALAALQKVDPTDQTEAWYRRMWQFAAERFIDQDHGGWFPEIGPDDRPQVTQFAGKPDIYHALQADLLPLARGLSAQASDLSRTQPLRD